MLRIPGGARISDTETTIVHLLKQCRAVMSRHMHRLASGRMPPLVVMICACIAEIVVPSCAPNTHAPILLFNGSGT